MDRNGWLKSMRLFVKLCGLHEGNINIITFDGHDTHWDADALDYLEQNHVKAFFFKSGDSKTDQPNDSTLQ